MEGYCRVSGSNLFAGDNEKSHYVYIEKFNETRGKGLEPPDEPDEKSSAESMDNILIICPGL